MERPTVLLFQKVINQFSFLPELELPKIADARIYLKPYLMQTTPQPGRKLFGKRLSTSIWKAQNWFGTTRFRFLELSYLQMAAPNRLFCECGTTFGQLRIQKDEEEIMKAPRRSNCPGCFKGNPAYDQSWNQRA